MPDHDFPTPEDLLHRAAQSYAHRSRPTVASCHRALRADVHNTNMARRAACLPAQRCPSRHALTRAIREMDAFEVHAARHGSVKARRRFGSRR